MPPRQGKAGPSQRDGAPERAPTRSPPARTASGGRATQPAAIDRRALGWELAGPARLERRTAGETTDHRSRPAPRYWLTYRHSACRYGPLEIQITNSGVAVPMLDVHRPPRVRCVPTPRPRCSAGSPHPDDWRGSTRRIRGSQRVPGCSCTGCGRCSSRARGDPRPRYKSWPPCAGASLTNGPAAGHRRGDEAVARRGGRSLAERGAGSGVPDEVPEGTGRQRAAHPPWLDILGRSAHPRDDRRASRQTITASRAGRTVLPG